MSLEKLKQLMKLIDRKWIDYEEMLPRNISQRRWKMEAPKATTHTIKKKIINMNFSSRIFMSNFESQKAATYYPIGSNSHRCLPSNCCVINCSTSVSNMKWLVKQYPHCGRVRWLGSRFPVGWRDGHPVEEHLSLFVELVAQLLNHLVTRFRVVVEGAVF